MKPRLKVGDTLIARETFNHPTRHAVHEVTVSKVGRKYFELERDMACSDRKFFFGKFLCDTWQWPDSNANWNHPVSIFQSREEMDERLAVDSIESEIKEWARDTWDAVGKLTADQARAIHAILFPPNPESTNK